MPRLCRQKAFSGRKGFELQFNWLFVLIAGGIILLFFFAVIKNQASGAETEQASELQQDVDFLFRGSLGSRESEKIIPVGGKVEFFCDEGVSTYIVEGSKVFSQYNYISVFSPSILDGDHFLLRTDLFRAPFHVMPFLYATNDNVEYVFVGNESEETLKILFDGLPKNSTKRFLDPSQLGGFKDNNYDFTIFISNQSTFEDEMSDVMTTKLASAISKNREDRFLLVVLRPKNDIVDYYGEIDFYTYGGSGVRKFQKAKGDYLFFTPELLLGAVYSGDASIYSCQFQKAIQRMNLISRLHMERIDALLQVPKYESDCVAEYGQMRNVLSDIASQTEDPGKSMSLDDVGDLFESIQEAKQCNARLLAKTSCHPVY
ncbi:hypothetical protein JW711_06290 [Candidatus Woesearchaeota archaeon]|nr:hypothetical protein [Candidatus Woesearchaeota archaeon]